MVTKQVHILLKISLESCSSEKIDGNKTRKSEEYEKDESCSSEKIDGNKTVFIPRLQKILSCSSEKIDGNKTN